MRNETVFEDEVIALNQRLIAQQELNQSDVDSILALHITKQKLFHKMKSCNPSTDSSMLKFLSQCVRQVEFAQQEKWKFGKNEHYHRWFEVPHCSCPKMDNKERVGTPYSIINTGCPIHGTV